LASDSNAIPNGLNEFGDLVVSSFVTETYDLGEVLLPVELYGTGKGLKIPFKGSVIFRTGLL
jgi:hypothetical protein